MYNFNSQKNLVVDYDKLMMALFKLPNSKINEVVNRARSLGISESYIQQGLDYINNVKKEIIEEK